MTFSCADRPERGPIAAVSRTRAGLLRALLAAAMALWHTVSINAAAPITGISTINTQQASVLAALKLKKPTQDAQMPLL